MDINQASREQETTEEDIELISFRKTNTSVDENMGELENGEYILIEKCHRNGNYIYFPLLSQK